MSDTTATYTLEPATRAALLPEMCAWLSGTSMSADLGDASPDGAEASVALWYPGGLEGFVRDVASRGRAWRRRTLPSIGELVEMRDWLTGLGCDVTDWSQDQVLTGVLMSYAGGIPAFLAAAL